MKADLNPAGSLREYFSDLSDFGVMDVVKGQQFHVVHPRNVDAPPKVNLPQRRHSADGSVSPSSADSSTPLPEASKWSATPMPASGSLPSKDKVFV